MGSTRNRDKLICRQSAVRLGNWKTHAYIKFLDDPVMDFPQGHSQLFPWTFLSHSHDLPSESSVSRQQPRANSSMHTHMEGESLGPAQIHRVLC